MTVPTSLRRWFVVHFAVDLMFALPLFAMPEATLTLLGWTTVDPVATRMVAAALAGIGVESLLMRNGSVDAFRAMLGLKCIWSGVAIAGLSLSIVRGAPASTWALLLIFVAFGAIWNNYRRRLRTVPA